MIFFGPIKYFITLLYLNIDLMIPPVTFVFVNIEELVRGEEDFIKEMKENTDTTIQVSPQGI